MTTIDDAEAGQERSAATIYDVATRAGVSISTVSLTLNQPARVSEATRTRVLEAIDDLHFVPKVAAVVRARRSLARIGVVAPFSSYASYAERLNGVLEVARERDVEVVLFDEPSAAENPSPLLSSLPLTGRLDGLIVMSLQLSDAAAERLLRSTVAAVLVDVVHPDFTCVVTDDEAGGRLAGEALLASGKPRFAFVGERRLSWEVVAQADLRLLGLRAALAAAGRDPEAIEEVETSNDLPGGRAALAQLLAASDEPVAVFAHHDVLASGVLQEARERGLAVPGDVAVVGFDDGPLAECLGLTTIAQPLRDSGRVAAQALLAAVDAGDGAPQVVSKVELGLRLVTRETT